MAPSLAFGNLLNVVRVSGLGIRKLFANVLEPTPSEVTKDILLDTTVLSWFRVTDLEKGLPQLDSAKQNTALLSYERKNEPVPGIRSTQRPKTKRVQTYKLFGRRRKDGKFATPTSKSRPFLGFWV